MANVVLDGADGILLGAETLRGRYPVSTVETITKICRQAEKVFDHVHHFDHLMAVRRPCIQDLLTYTARSPSPGRAVLCRLRLVQRVAAAGNACGRRAQPRKRVLMLVRCAVWSSAGAK